MAAWLDPSQAALLYVITSGLVADVMLAHNVKNRKQVKRRVYSLNRCSKDMTSQRIFKLAQQPTVNSAGGREKLLCVKHREYSVAESYVILN